MFKIILATCFVIFIQLSEVECKPRIIGGNEVKDASEFPYMCSLLTKYRVQGVDRWFHLCGCAIIHNKFVLTAGHCVKYVQRNKLKLNVTLGVVDITNGPHTWSTLVGYDDIILHENYSSNADYAVNDVALLRIRETMLLGRKVLPIRLPSRDHPTTYAGEIATLSGWGFRDTRKKNDPNILYYINEEILTNEECTAQNKKPDRYPATKESEICISTNYGRTACPGDSGSPLVVNDQVRGETLVGITSYVDLDKTCDPETAGPVVFMRTSYYLDWIEEKTGLKF